MGRTQAPYGMRLGDRKLLIRPAAAGRGAAAAAANPATTLAALVSACRRDNIVAGPCSRAVDGFAVANVQSAPAGCQNRSYQTRVNLNRDVGKFPLSSTNNLDGQNRRAAPRNAGQAAGGHSSSSRLFVSDAWHEISFG